LTSDLIPLELTDRIQQEQIVTSYGFNTKIRSLVLSLNHKYQDTVITTSVDSNWTKTIKIFAKELKRKNVTEDHITMICDVADINAVRILESIQGKQQENKSSPQTQAEIIIEIAKKMCKQFFHDQFNTAYAAIALGDHTEVAAIALGDHTEVIALDNKRFKNYICGAYYETKNSVPNAESITGAINVLKYEADFKGDE
jgi:putative Ca2+/H+ antiporter (TMEM165/GDT1 family)